jgi:hypothetical protein
MVRGSCIAYFFLPPLPACQYLWLTWLQMNDSRSFVTTWTIDIAKLEELTKKKEAIQLLEKVGEKSRKGWDNVPAGR